MAEFGFRISNLEDRKEFYEKEFDIQKLKIWFRKFPQYFCLDIGTETGIYRPELKKKFNRIIILRPNLTLEQLREKAIFYLPEDLYYDRNVYRDPAKCAGCFRFEKCWECDNFLGQELIFDIDPENIECPDCGKKEYPNFCPTCLGMALRQGLEMKKLLAGRFRDIELAYSGRGCHVHVHDEAAFKLTKQERAELNEEFKRFAFDRWVSDGTKRLVRVPYSLNALVSRSVLPLKDDEIEKFNPLKENSSIPQFLRIQ